MINKKKIEILYIVSTLRNSGPTNQLFGKMSNLDKNKFDVSVLTLSPDPSDNRKKDFLNANIKVFSLGLSRLQFQLKGKELLKKYINKTQPDIVHTTGVRADVAVSQMKISSKHCMTIRNFAHDDYIAKFGKIVGKKAAINNINAMKKCDYVICCSKTLGNMYSELLPQKLYVVQNGVDTHKFTPLDNVEKKVKLRESLGLPIDKKIFISVGSLNKRKDPLTVINAFKKANSENKAILIILGSGELMEQCKKHVDENILLKGNIKNVSDYLRASDVYVSASHSEGLPNSVLEAGRCGLSLVLSDIPQHKEVFEKNISLASFFNIENVEKLSVLIENEIISGSSDTKKTVADFIEDNFSNKIMSQKYEQIYQIMNI